MNVRVVDREMPASNALVMHIERKVRGAVKRFDARLSDVEVRVRDENGPRGGVDKICVIHASLLHGGRVVVSERGPDFFLAANQASHKLKRAVAKRVGGSRR